MDEPQRNKPHKSKTVGNKAAKKDALRKRRVGIDLEQNRGSNVKAFAGPSAGGHKAQKFFRSIEKKETALHVPTMDKTLCHVVAEPPLLVAVVGPPGVGKTTLIRSMVKFYSNRNLTSVRGPVTVISGRSRRITFMECPNDLASMCDVAKVADLVLLMVDGSYGFEMETFEFLNIAQVHGFPKIFGVVSHLDALKTGKAMKKRKKFLRHRFWHEVAAGAKLICLSPMVRGMYRPTDVLSLHRLLICVEPKIQAWRNTHSCVVIDRMEDITDPDVVANNPLHSRTVAFYGYARGKPMKPGQLVHIPGLGDFPVVHLSHQADPCQLDKFSRDSKEGGNHRMRHLSLKQKKLYAPYCDIGGISYDEDAIYIQEDAAKDAIERSGEGLRLLQELQNAQPINAAQTKLRVVPHRRRPMNFRDDDTMELDMEEVRMPSDADDDDWSDDAGARDECSNIVIDSDDDSGKRERQQRGTPRLSDFGVPEDGGDEAAIGGSDDDDEGSGEATLAPRLPNDPDSIRLNVIRHDWSDASLLRSLKDLCVTGNWEASAQGGDEEDANAVEEGSKGYDTSDEDFELEARGEKPMTCHSNGRIGAAAVAGFSTNGSDGDGESENRDDNFGFGEDRKSSHGTAAAPVRRNALASIGYGRSSSCGGRGSPRWGEGADVDDEYDGYNVLDDDSDGGEVAANGKAGRSVLDGTDSELEGLVSTFLTHGTSRNGNRSSRGSELTAAKAGFDGEDGIEFFDEATRYHRDDDGEDDRPRPRRRHVNPQEERNADEEAGAEAAVRQGGSLTAEQERLLLKKMAKKRAFNDEYDTGDADGGKNTTFSYYHRLNRQVEEKKERISEALDDVGDDIEKKIQLVGYFSGLYLRIVIDSVPVEFFKAFDPAIPLLAGGVNAGEDEFCIVQARLKRHRWFPRILKAQNPLLLSMGWRRFQTQPIFATDDPNGRHRYLKYTPLHMHCMAAFYAPVAPPNTGFLAIPVRDPRVSSFRIPCTGYTIGNDVSTPIVKKLKLTGTPAKVEKTTAFIKGMFSSDVEATKFIGAKLKAVSGIRGIIKSVMKGKQGLVRATFEDKLFPSDIVFIRAWKSVEPPRYCSMQRNLVDPEWVGMRSMRELRLDYNVPLPRNDDSEYTAIKRRHRVAEEDEDLTKQKVLLSRNLKLQLPYDMKEDFIPVNRDTALQERIKGATTVAPEPREQRRQALLDTFTDRADAMEQKKDAAKKRARDRSAKKAVKEQEEYLQGLKKAKKDTARMREFRTQHKSRK
ncbi:putative AARP2CN (NUC121) domain/40S ribosome biogenesis protein Tsr1 and BMS1 C-terminal [Leishmania naiffi]|uniref:AARP2CN (NUC121) domain/40S ribosome biogenesis protein Tsr1 and BMS1 C-terminal n=1 Tax=Leishmania naiffi TaxID=5678 RepID=A0AAW3BKY4_9TRYP